MVKENISLTQLFVLIFNFLLGSSIVIGLGKDAMQNAWIAILLMTFIGIGLMYLYYSINGILPNKNLFEILEYCFTRPISILLSLGYVIYFLHAIIKDDSYFWRDDYYGYSSQYPNRGYYLIYCASNGLYSLSGYRGIGKSI